MDDEMPLLTETTETYADRKGRTTIPVAHRGLLHQRIGRMNAGTAIGLLLLVLITLILIFSTHYPTPSLITSSTARMQSGPTPTKTERPTTRAPQPTNTRLIRIDPINTSLRPTIRVSGDIKFAGPWECGSAAVSKQITQELIERDCPHLLNAINSCCMVHDRCYDEQLGQKVCDSHFCETLSHVTLDLRSNSTAKCHDDHGPWFCEMVKAFGDSYYENAGLNTTLHSGLVDIFGQEASTRIFPSNRV